MQDKARKIHDRQLHLISFTNVNILSHTAAKCMSGHVGVLEDKQFMAQSKDSSWNVPDLVFRNLLSAPDHLRQMLANSMAHNNDWASIERMNARTDAVC